MPSAAAELAPTSPVVVQAEPLLVRAETAAELLGLSGRSFERLLAASRLPTPIRLGRRRLWRMADLEAFVAAGCRREPQQ